MIVAILVLCLITSNTQVNGHRDSTWLAAGSTRFPDQLTFFTLHYIYLLSKYWRLLEKYIKQVKCSLWYVAKQCEALKATILFDKLMTVSSEWCLSCFSTSGYCWVLQWRSTFCLVKDLHLNYTQVETRFILASIVVNFCKAPRLGPPPPRFKVQGFPCFSSPRHFCQMQFFPLVFHSVTNKRMTTWHSCQFHLSHH